ncbi:MAG TPA: hypothetical protein VFU89_06590 [Rhabdochlamydiaceae bacterium]|nr:hypothetical protein [Rhabdochlamydiaceae bacterium]
MTSNIDPNNYNNTGFFNDVKKTCTSLFDQLQDVFNKIPRLIEEKIAGLGSTHQVTASALTKDELKLKASFERAKADAAKDGLGTTLWIQNYGITDQNMLFEIAKIAAAQDGSGTSQNIKNYGITDQNMLFEIAKIAATQNGWGTSLWIQTYGIQNQSMLFEIAKIAAAQSGGGTSLSIQNYGIQDQNKLFEIAKIAAAQNGEETSTYIQYYGIQDQSRLFEIAKIAAAQNSLATIQNIQNYGLSSKQQIEILQLSLTYVFQSASETTNFLDLHKLTNHLVLVSPPNQNLFEEFAKVCKMEIPFPFETPEKKEQLEQTFKTAFVNLKNLAIASGVSNKTLALMEDTIFNKHTSLQQQRKDLLWLYTLVIHYKLDLTQNAIKQSPLCDESMGPLLNSILNTINPTLRSQATRALIEGYNHPEKRTSLISLISALKEERLHLIILFGTVAGISPSMMKKICEELPKTKYKDAKLMAPINEIMGAVYQSSALSEKQRLLELIFASPIKGDREPKPAFDKRLAEYRNNQRNWIAAMHSLLFFAQETLLNQVTNTTELVNAWQTFMGKTFYLKNEFLDQFFPTFGYSKRYPNALITYATRLQTLSPKDQLMALLGKFANSVLDKTFPQIRYDLTESVHLKSLFSENPELLKQWQTALSIETEDSSLPFTIEDTDAWEDLVLMGTEVNNSCQDILNNPTLNQCLLTAFLDGKVRLMVAREKETGKIIGRVVLRVLQDDKGKPVLFVDKLYTRNGVNSALICRNILEGCKQKAQSMGIALAASVIDYNGLTTHKYPGTLNSLGGPAPYEYVDAMNGSQQNGTYSIPESYVLWEPSL